MKMLPEMFRSFAVTAFAKIMRNDQPPALPNLLFARLTEECGLVSQKNWKHMYFKVETNSLNSYSI